MRQRLGGRSSLQVKQETVHAQQNRKLSRPTTQAVAVSIFISTVTFMLLTVCPATCNAFGVFVHLEMTHARSQKKHTRRAAISFTTSARRRETMHMEKPPDGKSTQKKSSTRILARRTCVCCSGLRDFPLGTVNNPFHFSLSLQIVPSGSRLRCLCFDTIMRHRQTSTESFGPYSAQSTSAGPFASI